MNLAPSLLSANFHNLERELNPLVEYDVKYLHLDVMDGHFVPNVSFGPSVISRLRPYYDFLFDAHLMVTDPDAMLEPIAQAGADIITVHYEAPRHIHRTLTEIRKLGKKAGISLNPATPISTLEYLLPELDLILIMTVNPGFGGQKFIPQMMDKIAAVREMIDESGYDIELEVDGGVTTDNAKEILDAGATILVAGSDVFSRGDLRTQLDRYRKVFEK